MTTPAGTNLVPSHGSVASSAKAPSAETRVMRSGGREASSVAPASAAAAGSSG